MTFDDTFGKSPNDELKNANQRATPPSGSIVAHRRLVLRLVRKWTNLEMRQREMDKKDVENHALGDVIEDKKTTAMLAVIKADQPKRWERHVNKSRCRSCKTISTKLSSDGLCDECWLELRY